MDDESSFKYKKKPFPGILAIARRHPKIFQKLDKIGGKNKHAAKPSPMAEASCIARESSIRHSREEETC